MRLVGSKKVIMVDEKCMWGQKLIIVKYEDLEVIMVLRKIKKK